jgi:hypothetical protein
MSRFRVPGRVRARARAFRRAAGVIVAFVVALGLGLGTAPAAVAAPTDDSEALARFLHGSVSGTDLDAIIALQGALAETPSGAASVDDPLSVSVLEALDIDIPGGIQLVGTGGLLTLGAIAQFAEAEADGAAAAGAGAVSNDGAVAIDGASGPISDAQLSLTPVLDGSSVVDALDITTGTLAATAGQQGIATPTSDYLIEGLTIGLESPLVSAIGSQLSTAVAGLQATLDTLQADLDTALDADLDLGALGSVSASAVVTVPTLSDALPSGPIVDAGGVTVDLVAGTLSIDLATVLLGAGLDLNDLSPNTELLSGAVLDAITDAVVDTLASIVQGVLDDVVAMIDAMTLSGDVGVTTFLGGVTITLGGPLSAPTAVVQPSGVVDLVLALLISSLSELTDPVLAQVAGVTAVLFGQVAGFQTTTGALITDLADDVAAPVFDAVDDVLTLTANVQPTELGGTGDLGAGSFTVRALSIGLLGGVATLDLASATVRGSLVIVPDPDPDPDPDPLPDPDPDPDPDPPLVPAAAYPPALALTGSDVALVLAAGLLGGFSGILILVVRRGVRSLR